MSKIKTSERVHFFDTDIEARTGSYGAVARRYSGQNLKLVVTEATADVLPPDVCPDTQKWVIQLFDRKSGEPVGVATETVTHGITFDKPVPDQFRENSNQLVRVDGDVIAEIYCVYVLEDKGTCQTNYVRTGTESYEVSFKKGHPLFDHSFTFEVDFQSHHVKRPDNSEFTHGVVYTDARTALAAAKRFVKAVL